MNRYNVVRRDGEGEEPRPGALPPVLEQVFDREVDGNDPRVMAALRGDKEATRNFRATQRVVDRLSRRVATPDLSESILAITHAKQPYAAPRAKRRRLSPARIAFSSGILAGIVLVVLLQTAAEPPKAAEPAVQITGNIAHGHLPEFVEPTVPFEQAPIDRVAIIPTEPMASVPTRQPSRPALSLGATAKYEPRGFAQPAPARVAVASSAGDFSGVGRGGLMTTSSASSLAYVPSALDPLGRNPELPILASAAIPTPDVAGEPVDVNTSSAELAASNQAWPPADVVQWLDHELTCGSLDAFKNTR
jgi:hypothetical protein